MSETALIPFDLSAHLCEECGQPKIRRLWEFLTGCTTCDAAVTRHRCVTRPALEFLAVGESWTCRECWSVWTVTEEMGTCGECGRSGPEKAWSYKRGGNVDNAPRHNPYTYVPLRNRLPGAGKCHRTPGGIMVHVKPDCRCRR